MADALSGTDYVSRLEAEFSTETEKCAVAMASVDAALHTALFLCGVKEGDYVFVPTFTFYSGIATVAHSGGVPVFLDCDGATRCVSPSALEAAFVWAELQNKPPRAVIVDDAFGSVADYDVLMPLCKAHGVPLIELATDALGGDYHGTPCGALGDYGIIGLNKRVGGGGAVLLTSPEDESAARGFSRKCYSENENHDYKIHNVIAALDCALLDASKKITQRARANLAALCDATDAVVRPAEGDAATFALCRAARHAAALSAEGLSVKLPPLVHTMPQYSTRPFFEHEQGFCAACSFSDCCLVDMDISAGKRRRLARLLKIYGK